MISSQFLWYKYSHHADFKLPVGLTDCGVVKNEEGAQHCLIYSVHRTGIMDVNHLKSMGHVEM